MAQPKKGNRRQWWAPVWTGLVMDKHARHYRKMGTAIWLFLYLFCQAEPKTGVLNSKVKTISSDMGIKRSTIIRWLNVLRDQEYVTTQNTGRGLYIQIRQWQNPTSGVANSLQQRSQKSDFCDDKNAISEVAFNRQNELKQGKKKHNPIDISINKNIKNIDIDREVLFNCRASKGLDKKQLLALELADALNDRKSLALYIAYSRRYPEKLLRKALTEAKDVPSAKIKKSRAALFNHLVQKHAQQALQDSGR